MVHSYLSVNNSSMADLETIMKTLILPELSSIPDAAAHLDRLLNLKGFAKKIRFSGKIHCEATMMALIYSFMPKLGSKPTCVPPFTNKVTTTLRPLLSVIISFPASPFFIDVFL
jgi:hypothetical protein